MYLNDKTGKPAHRKTLPRFMPKWRRQNEGMYYDVEHVPYRSDAGMLAMVVIVAMVILAIALAFWVWTI